MKCIIATMVVLMVFASMAFTGGAQEKGEKSKITVIRFINQNTDPPTVAVQREWRQDFVKENPTIDVIIEGASNVVVNQKLATYIQAGAPLDVLHADGGTTARLVAQGRALPLDDIVQKLGGEEEFLKGRLVKYEGKTYAINTGAGIPTLHYRKDVFEEKGLKPPDTWEELLDVSKKIHSKEMAAIALPGGENRATTLFSGDFLWSNQADFFDANLNVTLNNERVYEALEFYAKLLQYAPEEAAGWSFSEPIESFIAGRTAMILYWHGLDRVWLQRPELIDKIGLVMQPKGRIRATELGSRNLLVWKTTPNPEACKKWIEFVLRPENSIKMIEVSPMLYPPTTKAELEMVRKSTAASFQAYGDLLFDVAYPSAEFAYASIFHAGGISTEYDSPQETWIFNPLVSVVWNSNLYARAVQRVAYEGWSAKDAALEAHKELSKQVEIAKKELGLK